MNKKIGLVILIIAIILVYPGLSEWLDRKVIPSNGAIETAGVRLGATVPLSEIQGFGRKHGVSVTLDYSGAKRFYAYMTQTGNFSHLELGLGLGDIWAWYSWKDFAKGLVDASMEDYQRCTISLSIYMSLGYTDLRSDTFRAFRDLLVYIGPNKPALRNIFFVGEWAYKGCEPLSVFQDLQDAFFRVQALSLDGYGYPVGFHNGKYFKNFQSSESIAMGWGPCEAVAGISTSQDSLEGPYQTYLSVSTSPTKQPYQLGTCTGIYLLGMWDTAFNIPNTSPYYITYEKFDAIFKGARDARELSDKVKFIVFTVMPQTMNDVEGQVECPYLDWMDALVQVYPEVRTYKTIDELPRTPGSLSPPNPYPPDPTLVFVGNNASNLPPFVVPKGALWQGYTLYRNMRTMSGGQKNINYYLFPKNTPQTPITRYTFEEPYRSQWQLLGSWTTQTDGWGFPKITIPTTTSVGDYTIVGEFIGDNTTLLSSYSQTLEWIRVVDSGFRVKIQSTDRMRLAFGRSADGPPWTGMDPERWVDPTADPPIAEGYCSQEQWKFIAPTTSANGKTFNYWIVDDGVNTPYQATTSTLALMIDRAYTLTANYV